MSTYERIADLPLEIDGYALEGLSKTVSSGFERRTTVVHLQGGGEEGLGEDVTYDADNQIDQQVHGPVLPLAGGWTVASFSAHLGELDTFPAGPPKMPVFPNYRRWAFESAALDLALRQAGRSLADAVGSEPQPLTFVVSTRSGFEEWRRLVPGIRFKLDAEKEWTDEVVAELAATGAIDTVDLKGYYRGTRVDMPADPEIYRLVCEGFPDAWIEDPWVDERTRPVLEPHASRLTYDAPVHSVADAEKLPFTPVCLNVKPSRFGSIRRLFEFYAWAEQRGLDLYGGGQFELGPGRGQIQLLASLFHPDGPNDVAPKEFNEGGPRTGLAQSPLPPASREPGFR